MIRINSKGLFENKLIKMWHELYIRFSVRDFNSEFKYPKELELFLTLVCNIFEKDIKMKDSKYSFEHIKTDSSDTRIICAFSGGKDSLANILLLRELGYEPIPFFLNGINRSYTSELSHAKQITIELGLDLIVKDIVISGNSEFYENPIKNMLILAYMIDYGIQFNIPNYSFGVYSENSVYDISSEYMLSDGVELFETVELFYQSFIENFQVINFLHNETESFYEICKYDPKLLNMTYSCMSPDRYKNGYIKKAEKRYKTKLLPNRCPGSCYKCANEILVLNAFGITNYPDEYIKHCKDIIVKFYSKYNQEFADAYYGEESRIEWVIQTYIQQFELYKRNKHISKFDCYKGEWN